MIPADIARANDITQKAAMDLTAWAARATAIGAVAGFFFRAGVGDKMTEPRATVLVLSSVVPLDKETIDAIEQLVAKHWERVKAAGGKKEKDVKSFEIRGDPEKGN